jgi:hypothetical protein
MPGVSNSHSGESWRIGAACVGVDLSIFFPMNEHGESIQDAPIVDTPNTAGFYCLSCSAQKECLEYAIENKMYDGIYGATNELQRKTMINARVKANRQKRKRNGSDE